jgi:hypothetical protein
MTKKQRQQFLTKVTALLVSLGAKQADGEAYRFTLQTKAGRLRLQDFRCGLSRRPELSAAALGGRGAVGSP